MTTRRGFFGLLAGFAVAPRASWRDLWRPADIIYVAPTRNSTLFFSNETLEKLKANTPVFVDAKKIVIGQYADYYPIVTALLESPAVDRELELRGLAIDRAAAVDALVGIEGIAK